MVGSKNCNDHRNHGGGLVEVELPKADTASPVRAAHGAPKQVRHSPPHRTTPPEREFGCGEPSRCKGPHRSQVFSPLRRLASLSRDIAPMRGLALRQEKPFEARVDDKFMKGRCSPLKVRPPKSGDKIAAY